MKVSRLLFVVFLSPWLSIAQDKPAPEQPHSSCPITLDKPTMSSGVPGHAAPGTFIGYDAHNTSNKEVLAVKVHVTYYDQVFDGFDYELALLGSHSIKSGKSYKFEHYLATVDHDTLDWITPFQITLVKVRFADNTTWQDDGTNSCVSPK